MKHIVPILLAVLIINLHSTAVKAQTLNSSPFQHKTRSANIFPATYGSTNKVKSGVSKGTGAIGSRLIAEVHGNYDANHHWLPDSTVYTYSGSRGGDYENLITPYPLKYDSSLSWTTDPATLTYKLSRKTFQTINAQNNLATQVQQVWSGSAWVNDRRLFISYNSAAQIDTVLSQTYNTATNTWVNYDRISYTFNTGGYMTASGYETWSTTTNAFQIQVAYQYTLDANNNRATELELNYDMATMTLKPGFRIFHHYNTSNIEVSYAFQQSNNGSWVNTDSTAYIFNGSNMVIEYLYYSWNNATNAWVKSSHLLETYAGTGKLVSERDQSWNTTTGLYTTTDSTRSTYNSFDQTVYYHYYSFTTGVTDAETHYYYEQYATGIANHYATLRDVNVYPVPANEMLHLSIRLTRPQPINCNMVDAAGRTVRSWNDDASGAYVKELSLSGIPAGTYWLRVVTVEGIATKAIVVSHTN